MFLDPNLDVIWLAKELYWKGHEAQIENSITFQINLDFLFTKSKHDIDT